MTAVTLMKKQPKDQDGKIETASTYSWVLSQAERRAPAFQTHECGKAPSPCPTPEPPWGGQTAPAAPSPVLEAAWQGRGAVRTRQARGAACSQPVFPCAGCISYGQSLFSSRGSTVFDRSTNFSSSSPKGSAPASTPSTPTLCFPAARMSYSAQKPVTHPGPQVWQGHPSLLAKHTQRGCPTRALPPPSGSRRGR